MFYSNNPLIKHKTGLLNLAEELDNISQACKVMGMSRDTFYRYQQAVEQGGVDAPMALVSDECQCLSASNG